MSLGVRRAGPRLAVLVELVEELVGEAGLRGELPHHPGEKDGVGRHRRFRDDVGMLAAGGREEQGGERELAREAHVEIRR